MSQPVRSLVQTGHVTLRLGVMEFLHLSCSSSTLYLAALTILLATIFLYRMFTAEERANNKYNYMHCNKRSENG